MRNNGIIAAYLCGAAIGGFLPHVALAQSAQVGSTAASPEAAEARSSGGVEDIIVTAQRQEQRLQDVPIAITAVTAQGLVARGITQLTPDILSLTVPGLSGASLPGGKSAYFLRGVGSNATQANNEPSVALYVDGVYIPSASANAFSFNNIERIEVLKGPQGTLFGRNATGGVIQIVTRDPSLDQYKADFKFGYGNYESIMGSGYVSVPITSTLATDVAIQVDDRNKGFGRIINLNKEIGRRHAFGIRSKTLLEPSDRTQVRLVVDYARNKSDGPPTQKPNGVPSNVGVIAPPTGGNDAYLTIAPRFKTSQLGVSLKIDQDVNFAHLTSITSYRRVIGSGTYDADGWEALWINAAPINSRGYYVTQELQLSSQKGSKIDWQVGGYFFDAKTNAYGSRNEGPALGPGMFATNDGRQTTRSGSIFGQATAEILPNVKLTGGARYTLEKQRVTGFTANISGPGPFVDKEQSYKKLTWRAALDYEFVKNIHAYVSANRGTKSGGFNISNPTQPGYRPEVVDAYEVGLKSELFDRHLRLNVSGFYYKYSDIQVFQTVLGFSTILNAASARVYGLDLDFEASPISNLSIYGGATFLNSKFTDYKNTLFYRASPFYGPPTLEDATGNQLSSAPRFTGNIGATYRVPSSVGEFLLSGFASYNSGFYWNYANRFRQPHYTVVNANLGWTSNSGRFGLGIWGKNLTKARYNVFGTEGANGLIESRADPRTYGVTANVSF